jgi:hypothetical protein
MARLCIEATASYAADHLGAVIQFDDTFASQPFSTILQCLRALEAIIGIDLQRPGDRVQGF